MNHVYHREQEIDNGVSRFNQRLNVYPRALMCCSTLTRSISEILLFDFDIRFMSVIDLSWKLYHGITFSENQLRPDNRWAVRVASY